MDEGSGSDPNDLPHLVWRDGWHGLAKHAIRQSESVSDDTAGLSDGMSGRDLPVPSGSAHGDLGVRSLCGQTDRIVLLVRATVARLLESCEATRIGISLGLARVGDSDVAVGERLRVRGEGIGCGWNLEVGGIKGEAEAEQLGNFFNRLLG